MPFGEGLFSKAKALFLGNSQEEQYDDTPDNDSNSKKRKVLHVEVTGSRKKVDRRSEQRRSQERRLTGDFVVPSNAQRILPPGSFPQVAEVEEVAVKEADRRMSRTKPGAGPRWQARDTLRDARFNSSPQQSAAEAKFAKYQDQFPQQKVKTNYTAAMKGQYANGVAGDGFDRREREQPPAKRQKMDHGTARRDLASDPIELDDDEDGITTPVVTSVNGKAVKARSNAARVQAPVGTSRSKPFEGAEHKTVDAAVGPQQQKNRRRQPNGNHSSRASSRPPSSLENAASSHEVIDLGDEDDSLQEIPRPQPKPSSSQSDKSLPPVQDLSKGLDEIGDGKQLRQRQSGDSVQLISEQPKPKTQKTSMNGSHAHHTQRQARPTPRRRISQGDGADVTSRFMQDKQRRRSVDQGEDEQRLNDIFSRDDAPSRKSATKGTASQREKMKASSGVRVSAVDDSLGSVDELQGPTTVGSVSPEKRPNGAVESRPQDHGQRKTSSGSLSDLKPTQFTQSREVRRAGNGGSVKVSSHDEEYDSRIEIPLAQFCAASCILGEGCGDITLRWDERALELDVYCNGELQLVRGGKCTVHIGKAEINKIHQGRESPNIYLWGSGTLNGVSNGHICFRLADVRDKDWVMNRLLLIAGSNYRLETETDERMEMMGRKKAAEIFQAWKKRQASNATEQVPVSQLASERPTGPGPEPEERMRYESDRTEKPNRRKGMLGRDIVDHETDSSKAHRKPDLEQSPYFPARRSTRQTKQRTPPPPQPPKEKWTQVNKLIPWSQSVVYPTEGARRVTVDFLDLERLDEDEFLNDNIIQFALRRIEENMPTEHKERMHFFNSFFYSALTTKNGKKAFNYDAVKRWTKSKDLFSCDYVVVPICIEFHWFVAIICNLPNLPRRVDQVEQDAEDQDNAGEQDQAIASDVVEPLSAADDERSTRVTPEEAKAMRNLSISDDEGKSKTLRAQAEDDGTSAPQAQIAETTDSPTTAKKSGPARKAKKRPPSYNPEKPAIITLDSLGLSHTAEIRNLKDYISKEAQAKRGMAVEPGQLQGLNAKGKGIPIQEGFSDCGVYLVGYIEQFVRDPRAFATKALRRDLDNIADFADFDSSKKRDEIRKELLKLHKEQDAAHKAKKAGKKSAAANTESKTGGSAAATPKPESKPASKAASPVTEPTGPLPIATHQELAVTWVPKESTVSTAREQNDQDRDLEFEPPRALGGDSRPAGAGMRHPPPFEDESGSDEMLDDPRQARESEPQDSPATTRPNPLLDKLEVQVRRSSQQAALMPDEQEMQQDLHAQLQEAAAQGEQSDQASVEEPEWNGLSSVDNETETIAPPSDVRKHETESDHGGQDDFLSAGGVPVIDLGDDDDAPAVPRTEIPDSQEQAHPSTQKGPAKDNA